MKTTFAAAILAAGLMARGAWATPSTQIWIPSTDVQKFKSVHLTADSYMRARKEPDGSRKAPITVFGPTIGVLPYEKVQAEAGFDAIFQGDSRLDDHPVYFHAKLGTPESSFADWSPALAAGGYNFGTKPGLTNQNMIYGLAARTLPVVGRLSAGYYRGSKSVLVDENGGPSYQGVLLSWDRVIKEVSEKLWLGVDYQGGRSSLGALNFGAGWSFTPSVSAIVGYDLYNNRRVAGRNTVTVQVDINL